VSTAEDGTEHRHDGGASGPARRASPPTRRVVDLIELLAREPGRRLSQADMVRALGLSKATCHAIVRELVDAGWLRAAADGETSYVLGAALARIGRSSTAGLPLLEAGRAALEALSVEVEAVIIAGHVEGDEIVVLERYGVPLSAEMETPIGARFPLTPPFGVTFLAWAHPKVVDRWIAGNGNGPGGDRRRLLGVLASVRRLGFSVDRFSSPILELRRLLAVAAASGSDELEAVMQSVLAEMGGRVHLVDELRPGCELDVNLISAPVFDEHGQPSVNLSLQLARRGMGYDEVTVLAQRLTHIARELTEGSGGRVPTTIEAMAVAD
jgi:DNA-binding IclR family transcriptional regulator